MTTEETIRHFEAQAQCGYAPTREAAQMAIAALRAQREPVKLVRSRWHRCPFCAYELSRAKRVCAYTAMGSCEIPARFCPNCGCPLTEEAKAELERRIGGNDGKTD